jgi:CheY-like chemotaxis protein
MRLTDWKVLVVEDEVDSMEMVQEILEYYGVRCVPASTAEDALNELRSLQPTLIIIDLALPGMDGWSLLAEIQRRPMLADVPCVAITAYDSFEVAEHAIEKGFEAYFPKPLDATSFVRELQGIIVG